jgi:hypothetical protein
MSSNSKPIPLYSAAGHCLGWRSPAAAQALVDGSIGEASYGPKGHLKAVWLRDANGSSHVDTHVRLSRRYSFLQKLDNGRRCWTLRRLGSC